MEPAFRPSSFGTSIRFLQSHGWPQIDILAEEVIRRSPAWNCTLIGRVLEEECNALFTASQAAAQLPAAQLINAQASRRAVDDPAMSRRFTAREGSERG